jgi:hypothetical protein
MPIYKKPSKELVYDLINEANPQLALPVTQSNVGLGTPTAITGTSWPANNTKITLSPAPGTGDFIGRQEVNYRRLDLSALFRGQVILIKKFKSTAGSVTGTLMYTLYQLLGDINTRYGMNLTEDDLTNVNILRGNVLEDGQYTTTVTVSTKATSLGYTGTFQLKWLNTKQSLEDMITVRELSGRLVPGGNDFSGEHTDVLTMAGYGLDVSQAWVQTGSTWNGTAWAKTNIVAGSYPPIVLMLNSVNAKCGTDYKITSGGNSQTTPGEFAGFTWQCVVLPNANFPDANSTDFNRLFIFYPPDNCPWAAGELYLHCNYPF